MRYFPFNYDQINVAAGTCSPSAIKAYNNASFWYWSRSLFQRMISVIDMEIPEEWSGGVKDFFKWCLYSFGFVAISKNDRFGSFFQPCTLSGYDLYYQPRIAIISNPIYQAELEIGRDCEILKLSPDYFGTFDIIERFAAQLSELDNAINMSIVNSKFAFLYGARNKTAGNALKKMLDLVNQGEPAVVWDMKILNDPTDKEPPFQELTRTDLKSNYLTTDQLADLQTILNNFDAEIGIRSVPYQKKERLVAAEAEMRDQDAVARSTVWLQTLRSSAELVMDLYPDIELSFDLKYEDWEGGTEDELG